MAGNFQELLLNHGFSGTESHLTEWNMGIRDTKSARNAGFTAAMFAWMQDTSIDVATKYRGDDHSLGMFYGAQRTSPTYAFTAMNRMREAPRRLKVHHASELAALAGRSDKEPLVMILLSNPDSFPRYYRLRVNNLLGDGPYTYQRYVINSSMNLEKVEGIRFEGSPSFFTEEGIMPYEVHLIHLRGTGHGGQIDWGAPFGFLDASPNPDEYADLGSQWVMMGAAWARWDKIETTEGVYDWTRVDLTNLQNMDTLSLRFIPELRSINPLYGTYRDTDEYPDGNLAAWADFISALVEKFDGDGVEDLDGAPTIRTYSFLHELMPQDRNYWTNHPHEYAEMFNTTYQAMKSSCADCILFLPGANLSDFQFQDEGALEEGWIVEVLGDLGGYDTSFDDIGFDYHHWSEPVSYSDPYSDGKDYRLHKTLIEAVRHCYERFGYSNRPIISRESGMTGIAENEPFDTNEPLQAAYVAKIYTLTASLGQKVCAWTTTSEYSHYPMGNLFQNMGIVHNPQNPGGLSHRKLAWYTYKKMTEKLNKADWDNVKTVVDGTDNVYAYRFNVGGRFIHIAWWDYFKEQDRPSGDTKSIVLSGLSGSEATVTDLVPDYVDGSQLSDYETAFTITNTPIVEGSTTIILGKDPLMLEVSVNVMRYGKRPTVDNLTSS